MKGIPVLGGPRNGELFYPDPDNPPAPGAHVLFPGAGVPGGEYFLSEDGASVVWFVDDFDGDDPDATPLAEES